jgi:hypothetical protein
MKQKPKKAKARTNKSMGRLFRTDALLKQEVEYVSEGSDQEGRDYDFYLGKISRSPIVKSRTTGRHFILPWTDIIKIGIKAGLNKAK